MVLVDVLVATILLGASLAVLIGLTGRSVSSRVEGEERATAAALADEQLQMVLARGPDDYQRRFPLEGACEAPFQAYRYRLEFGNSAGVSEPLRVRVTISWGTMLGGGARSVTIETLMASRYAGEDGESDPERAPQTPVVRTP